MKALNTAAMVGDVETIRELLNLPSLKINETDDVIGTALHYAVLGLKLEAVKVLIEEGKADPNIINKQGNTPLHDAAYKKHTEMVEVMIKNGGKPLLFTAHNSEKHEDLSTYSITMHMRDPDTLKLLVSTEEGKKLLKENAGEFIADAVRLGGVADAHKLVKALLEADSTSIISKEIIQDYGKTILQAAAGTQCMTELAKLMLGNKENFKIAAAGEVSALHSAVGNGCLGIVKFFLDDRTLNVNIKDQDGFTPFHYSVLTEQGKYALGVLLDSDRVDFNAQDKEGNTALLLAASKGVQYEGVVKDILARGIDPNIANNIGETALHKAVLSKAYSSVVLLLRNVNTKLDAVAKGGYNPLLYSLANKDMVMAKKLTEKGADVNKVADNGDTAVFWLANKPYTVTDLKYFVDEKGAVLDVQNSKGNTPLIIAAKSDDPHKVAFIVDHKVDVNKVDGGGVNAMMWGALNCNYGMVGKLAKAGTNLTHIDKANNTIFTYIENCKDVVLAPAILKLVIEYGDKFLSRDEKISFLKLFAKHNGKDPASVDKMYEEDAEKAAKEKEASNSVIIEDQQLPLNSEQDVGGQHKAINDEL